MMWLKSVSPVTALSFHSSAYQQVYQQMANVVWALTNSKTFSDLGGNKDTMQKDGLFIKKSGIKYIKFYFAAFSWML